MARKKDQAARRQQLVSATIELIAEHGIERLTLAAIADRVGVSHRLVAYYYAELESLVHEAHEAAAQRYYWARLRGLDETADPELRLLQLIGSGLPRQQDRQLSQVLNELSVNSARSDVHARLMGELNEREVSLYLPVLRDGEATGVFRLTDGPDRGPQPGRAGGRLRLPPARADLPGRRGRRAERHHQLRPDRHRRQPAQPLSAAMIACTASSVSRSSGWLSGSGQCDSLTTTVRDGGWTKMFWP